VSTVSDDVVTPEIVTAAHHDADAAAARAQVEVRALHSHDELTDARGIWDAVWPTVAGATEITGNLLRALEHAGGYVGGAYVGDRMVGSCLAFVGRTRASDGWHEHLHSHVAAALPGFADRGIGTALKLHQRAWALRHDIDRIVWTFDPLVRRNARLNLVKLGGIGVEYLVNFYGEMDDALNVGDESDRLLLQWDLASSRVADAMSRSAPAITREAWLALGATDALLATEDGPRLVETSSPVVLVAVPNDIVDIRRVDLPLGKRWRRQVRAALEPVVSAGGRVVGLTTDGCYVVEVKS
jgi:predicted GNAT superfamily acetyltransferase